MKDNSKRIAMHHYMVAGEITFSMKQEDDTYQQGVVKQNSVFLTKNVKLRVQELSKAQQALQMRLLTKLGEQGVPMDKVQITNVVIITITHLGLMTEEEFNEPPEGTKMEAQKVNLDQIMASK